MSIIRTCHNRENPYITVNKIPIEDPNLSWAAKGLWTYLMGRPDNWNVSVKHLQGVFGTPGKRGSNRDAILGLLKELIENGYCSRVQIKEKGKIVCCEYTVYEFKTKVPQTPQPDTAEPDTAKALHNKERSSLEGELPSEIPIAPPSKDKASNIYVPNAVALEHAEFLFQQILKIKPNYKPPNLKAWSKSIDKMMTLDKRSNEEIRAILEWLPSSSFWGKNILSADKLREKFDQLELARESEEKSDWYRQNLSQVITWKKGCPEVLKHLVIKGDYVINPENSKELNLKITNPSQLKVIFASVAGVRLNG